MEYIIIGLGVLAMIFILLCKEEEIHKRAENEKILNELIKKEMES